MPATDRKYCAATLRWAGSDALSKTTIVKDVGGLMRPKGPFAQKDEDLSKFIL